MSAPPPGERPAPGADTPVPKDIQHLRRAPPRYARIAALLRVDLRAWARERVFFVLSFVGVFLYAGVSLLLPDAVDETLRIGLRAPAGASALIPSQPGLVVVPFPTAEALREAVAASAYDDAEGRHDLLVGLDFAEPQAPDPRPRVTVHLSPKAPPELGLAAQTIVRELALHAAGHPVPVTLPAHDELIRGDDLLGHQASLRARMRPLAALLVLALEMFSVASLITRELQSRTVLAVLATPATPLDWLLAKLLFGALVALTQALLLLTLIGALGVAPLQLLLLITLGTLLFTGLGLLAGARARDFSEVLFYSFVLLVPALIPAFALLFPGPTSPFVTLLPTYPIAVALFRASDGATWPALLLYIAATCAWVAVLVGLGVAALRRALRRL